jgi:hypothetical protein
VNDKVNLVDYMTNKGMIGYKLANKQYLNAPFEDYRPEAEDKDEIAKWQSEITRSNRILHG